MGDNNITSMSPQELMDYMARGITTPPAKGTAFADLSSSGTTTGTCKSLYVIETDDNPRDFSAAPKVYGAYWSDTPDAVNRVAINLWPAFGDPAQRDDEHNVDGSRTKPGHCYQGSACLGNGQKFLSMAVRKLKSAAAMRAFPTPLVAKVLESRGLLPSVGDVDKDEMIQRAAEAGIIE